MEKIGLKYGLLTAAGLALYFLLMKLLGMEAIIELRYLNGLIMAAGIVLALQAHKKSCKGHVGYFKGILTGLITTVIGTVLFAVFMLVYMKTGSKHLLDVLSGERYFGEQIVHTPGVVVFSVLLLEGVFSGAMITFIAMQYFKPRDHKVPNSP